MENTYLEDLDGEIWKEIDGYNGIYFISNKGRVKSYLKYANGEIIGKNSSSVILKDSDGKRTYFNKAKLLNDYFTKIDYNADLDGEIWKDVKGYEGLYKVSNKGRVKSYSRYEEGRILKQNLNVGGYYVVGLTKDRKNVPKTVHRLVAEAFIPNPNNYPEINRAKTVESDITTSLQALKTTVQEEKQRSADKDTEHSNAINAETARATAKENEIAANLQTEVQRAQDREKHIDDDLHSEIDRAKAEEARIEALINSNADKDAEVKEAIENEIKRATEKEKELETTISNVDDNLTAEINRAVAKENELEAAISDNADKIADIQTALNTVSDNLDAEVTRATDKENAIEAKVDTNTTAIADEVSRATAKEVEIADNLTAETDRAKQAEQDIKDLIAANADADATLQNDLTAEIVRAKSEEGRIENITSVNASNITSEINRAKQVEADITTSLQQLKTTVQTKDNEHSNAIADLQTALQSEVSRSTTKDTEIDGKLDIINGDSTVIGSISHSLADSKHYTDDEIAKLKTSVSGDVENSLKNYATKAEVDSRIETLIGTAPEALDTLGEIADKLNDNSDVITAINGVLSGKANASDVYTKNEIDTKETAINNAIATEVSRATNAENTIATDLTTEVNRAKAAETAIETKVDTNTTAINAEVSRAKEAEKTISDNLATEVNRAKAKENELATSITDLQSALNAEVTRSTNADTSIANDLVTETNRAKAAEKSNADAIAIINGGESVIGSISHGVADAKHYADDLLSGLQADINVSLSNMATKNDVATVDGKLTAHISEADSKFATKSDVDDKLATKADTSMLDNYATKTSLQGVADMATANANAIDTINDTLPTKADKSDTYTKTEVDTLIDNVDVTEQLKDYAKVAETTAIKDENGNIITEMVIDNSDADDSVEVYTKEQCDERFAKIWSGTQSEYDALTTKDNNTLYIIK